MEVERAFGVTIPDAEAAKLATVGDLHRYVVTTSIAAGQSIEAEEAWKQLCDILEHSYAFHAARSGRTRGSSLILGSTELQRRERFT